MIHRMNLALRGALLLGAFAGFLSPAMAMTETGTTPSLRVRADGDLAIEGDRNRPMLLLVGDSVDGTETCGRRVEARRVLRIDLDLNGRYRLPGKPFDGRTTLQAWQPPLAGQPLGQGYSVPVTLLPAGPRLASVASPGDLVVTEFMKDPTAVTDSHGEWIELRSNKTWRLDIEGVTIRDLGGASFTLNNGGQGILLAPGQRFVLGNDMDPATNGGVPVDYQWSGFSLKNSADEILVHAISGNPIDKVKYDDGVRWPDTPGMSIALSAGIHSSVANDDAAMWCHSSTPMAGGSDTGTPGAVNGVCP